MPDDIVTRLRRIVPIHEGRIGHDCIAEAADEIERLRGVNTRCAEMLRIKDDLINAQVRKIMHLSGVKG